MNSTEVIDYLIDNIKRINHKDGSREYVIGGVISFSSVEIARVISKNTVILGIRVPLDLFILDETQLRGQKGDEPTRPTGNLGQYIDNVWDEISPCCICKNRNFAFVCNKCTREEERMSEDMLNLLGTPNFTSGSHKRWNEYWTKDQLIQKVEFEKLIQNIEEIITAIKYRAEESLQSDVPNTTPKGEALNLALYWDDLKKILMKLNLKND